MNSKQLGVILGIIAITLIIVMILRNNSQNTAFDQQNTTTNNNPIKSLEGAFSNNQFHADPAPALNDNVQQNANFKTYQNKQLGYEFSYPNTFQIKQNLNAFNEVQLTGSGFSGSIVIDNLGRGVVVSPTQVSILNGKIDPKDISKALDDMYTKNCGVEAFGQIYNSCIGFLAFQYNSKNYEISFDDEIGGSDYREAVKTILSTFKFAK